MHLRRPCRAGAHRSFRRLSLVLCPGGNFAVAHAFFIREVTPFTGATDIKTWWPKPGCTMTYQLDVIHTILTDVDLMLQERLTEASADFAHILMVIGPDGKAIVRANIGPVSLKALAEDLAEFADSAIRQQHNGPRHRQRVGGGIISLLHCTSIPNRLVIES